MLVALLAAGGCHVELGSLGEIDSETEIATSTMSFSTTSEQTPGTTTDKGPGSSSGTSSTGAVETGQQTLDCGPMDDLVSPSFTIDASAWPTPYAVDAACTVVSATAGVPVTIVLDCEGIEIGIALHTSSGLAGRLEAGLDVALYYSAVQALHDKLTLRDNAQDLLVLGFQGVGFALEPEFLAPLEVETVTDNCERETYCDDACAFDERGAYDLSFEGTTARIYGGTSGTLIGDLSGQVYLVDAPVLTLFGYDPDARGCCALDGWNHYDFLAVAQSP